MVVPDRLALYAFIGYLRISAEHKQRNPSVVVQFSETFRSIEYRFFKKQVLWPEAKLECKKHKGHLVTVDSKNEFDYLMANLR